MDEQGELIVKSARIVWGVGNIAGPFAFLATIEEAKKVAKQFSTPVTDVPVFPFVVYTSADAYTLAHAHWVSHKKSEESSGA